MASAKEQLRSQMRQIRSAIPQDEWLRAEQAASGQVLGLPELQTAGVVGLYAAIATELRTAALADALTARGIRLAYPRIVPGQRVLRFHRVASPADLVPGPLRIPQPPAHAAPMALDRIDLLIVPGLAFDRQGGRMGWGMGYYDASLMTSGDRRPLCVGYAHESQVVNDVPRGSQDVLMDILVTDAGIVRIDARAKGPVS